MKSATRNLIISPVGPGPACHRLWTRGRRDFDLMLVNYSDTPGYRRSEADHYAEGRGFKLEVLEQAISSNLALVMEYDAVWLPDPDLAIGAAEIDALFRIFREFELDLAQPAVSNRNFCHEITRRRPDCHLRYVNFVEIMCPLFERSLLIEALDSFRLNRSGWGIDWYWSWRFRDRRLAVIDAVSVEHTRRMRRRGPYYRKLRSLEISAGAEMDQLIRKFEIDTRFREFGRVPAREASRPRPASRLARPFQGAVRRLRGR